jgi:hypothetical protein
MNHEPKTLALLISLIGVGVSPYASARSDYHEFGDARLGEAQLGETPASLAATLAEASASLLQRSDPSTEWMWRPEPRIAEVVSAPRFQIVYRPFADDWAPGEARSTSEELVYLTHANSRTTQEAAETAPATQPKRKRSARNTENIEESVGESVEKNAEKSASSEDAKPAAAKTARRTRQAVDRLEEPQAVATAIATGVAGSEAKQPARQKQRGEKARGRKTAVSALVIEAKEQPRFDATVESIPQQQVVEAKSEQSERLFEALVTVLAQEPAAPPEVVAALPVLEDEVVLPVLRDEVKVFDAALPAARLDRIDVAIEPQSTVVLRSLELILSEHRNEVGAIKTEPRQDVVASHVDKVMALLGEVSTARQVIETGPEKRARKLAALAAKKAAAQAEAARAEHATHLTEVAAAIAAYGVDLLLPLEAATYAVDIDLGDASIGKAMELPPLALGVRASEGEAAPRKNPFGDRQVALAENTLDRVRGGFVTDGLNISFGIERAVYVNGSLVTSTTFNVNDLGRMTGGRSVPSLDANTIGLVQNGAGNVVTTGSLSSGAIGTIVQNTLDGQKIQNVTVINATTNSLGVLRGLNLQSSLRGAVIDSLRR